MKSLDTSCAGNGKDRVDAVVNIWNMRDTHMNFLSLPRQVGLLLNRVDCVEQTRLCVEVKGVVL